ncbi:MAG: hypothetical protein ACK4Q4_06395 [Rhodocyclaceae bacterium]
MPLIVEPRFRASRIWSNRILQQIAPLLTGSVVNVSAWRDEDKEGNHYRNYFARATEYWLTNWHSNARGFQGNLENELFLDLEQPLPAKLRGRFDIVFNHTTLEHVFDIFSAFRNLCSLSRDVVILVVPFLQEQHGDYGDYWRFTPLSIQRLFAREERNVDFVAWNDGAVDAIYIVAASALRVTSSELLRKAPGNRLDILGSARLGRRFFPRTKAGTIVKRLLSLCRGS